MNKVKVMLHLPKLLVTTLIYKSIPHDKIDKDIVQYMKQYMPNSEFNSKASIKCLWEILLSDKAFHSVFLYRLHKSKIRGMIYKFMWHPLKTIEIGSISPDGIAGGLWISHHYCVVSPYSAGENLRIGPGVTIGLKKEKVR